jgi:hypothetical protein
VDWVDPRDGLRLLHQVNVGLATTVAHYQESQIRHFNRTLDMYVHGENGRVRWFQRSTDPRSRIISEVTRPLGVQASGTL